MLVTGVAAKVTISTLSLGGNLLWEVPLQQVRR